MHTRQFHRTALALLILLALAFAEVAAAAAWGLDLTGWIAVSALAVAAVVMAAAKRLHENWQAARWDAGQRLR